MSNARAPRNAATSAFSSARSELESDTGHSLSRFLLAPLPASITGRDFLESVSRAILRPCADLSEEPLGRFLLRQIQQQSGQLVERGIAFSAPTNLRRCLLHMADQLQVGHQSNDPVVRTWCAWLFPSPPPPARRCLTCRIDR